MKYTPPAQESVIAALRELELLRDEWEVQQWAEATVYRIGREQAQREAEARRRQTEQRVRAAARRERERRGRRKAARDRAERAAIAAAQARASAGFDDRIRRTRASIDAQLSRARRRELGRVAGVLIVALGLFGLGGWGLSSSELADQDQRRDTVGAQYERARTAGEQRDALASLRERSNALAAAHADLSDRHAQWLERAAETPASPGRIDEPRAEGAEKVDRPRPRKRPTKVERVEPAPSEARPPIRLEFDGNPLDGIG